MYIFSYLSVLTFVLGAQKNRLVETVLLSSHNICLIEKYEHHILIPHSYLEVWSRMITAGHCGGQRFNKICDKSVDSEQEPQKKAFVVCFRTYQNDKALKPICYIEFVMKWMQHKHHEVTFFIDWRELVHNNRIVFEISSENDVNLYSEYVLKKTFITYGESFIELLDLMAS